jgi:hypothetical protein
MSDFLLKLVATPVPAACLEGTRLERCWEAGGEEEFQRSLLSLRFKKSPCFQRKVSDDANNTRRKITEKPRRFGRGFSHCSRSKQKRRSRFRPSESTRTNRGCPMGTTRRSAVALTGRRRLLLAMTPGDVGGWGHGSNSTENQENDNDHEDQPQSSGRGNNPVSAMRPSSRLI